jgi:hypothetical protein
MAKAVIVRKQVIRSADADKVLIACTELKKLCSYYADSIDVWLGRYGTNKAELRKAAKK